jgi:hypothetical protein
MDVKGMTKVSICQMDSKFHPEDLRAEDYTFFKFNWGTYMYDEELSREDSENIELSSFVFDEYGIGEGMAFV